jgi:magnesium chelatase family protein
MCLHLNSHINHCVNENHLFFKFKSYVIGDDELSEFDRKVLEVLREPLESGRITISRAARQADFSANFQLIAAMSPCPCSYLGHHNNKCRCTPDQVSRYKAKISGPLLDRIDLHIEVPALKEDELINASVSEHSQSVRARVEKARAKQLARQGKPNHLLGTKEIETHCETTEAGLTLLKLQYHASICPHERITGY